MERVRHYLQVAARRLTSVRAAAATWTPSITRMATLRRMGQGLRRWGWQVLHHGQTAMPQVPWTPGSRRHDRASTTRASAGKGLVAVAARRFCAAIRLPLWPLAAHSRHLLGPPPMGLPALATAVAGRPMGIITTTTTITTSITATGRSLAFRGHSAAARVVAAVSSAVMAQGGSLPTVTSVTSSARPTLARRRLCSARRRNRGEPSKRWRSLRRVVAAVARRAGATLGSLRPLSVPASPLPPLLATLAHRAAIIATGWITGRAMVVALAAASQF